MSRITNIIATNTNDNLTASNTIKDQPGTQEPFRVFAPVITDDVTLPDSAQKVPMVMVPVPDSRTIMAIPVSTLNQIKEAQQPNAPHDELQARNLLAWNDDGIGTLDGCDLRFRINQFGCLELLDSDDESAVNIDVNSKKKSSVNGHSEAQNNNDRDEKVTKKVRTESEQPAPMRQISPGSSLLRDGPNIRRPKSNSAMRYRANSLSLHRRSEQCQNSILLDKLIPKQRLEEIKTNLDRWTVEDVKDFIDSIPGCQGYGELFEIQQICGQSLVHLDQKDLLDVVNVKLGPAVKIYHAISLLK